MNPKPTYTYTREQLKRRRMLVRAGIGILMRTIEEHELIKLCIYHDRDRFMQWHDRYYRCRDKEHDVFMRALRQLAVEMGLKHWRLRAPKLNTP